MTRSAISLAIILLYGLSLYGWGEVACRVARLRGLPWPVAAAIGLASWILLGGLFNLFAVAYPGTLNAVVVSGWGLCALCAWSRRDSLRIAFRDLAISAVAFENILLWLLIAGMAAFTTLTQLPPRAYNYHDDFQTYLPHSVRMLETGTLYGNPLSSIGRKTLGGQAILQGFVLAHFPIQYVNGADAVFCLLLCLAMICAFGTTFPPRSFLPTALALLLTVVINPQYVNVSSLYSGSALIMTLMLIEAVARNDYTGRREQHRPLAITALIYSGLVALKPTFTPFVGLHFLLSVALHGRLHRSIRRSVERAVVLSGATAIFLSPWILLHSEHYLRGLSASPIFGLPTKGAPAARPSVGLLPFSGVTLYYGDSFLHYTVVVIGVGIIGVTFAAFALHPLGNAARREARCALAVSCFAACGSYIFLWSWLGRMMGFGAALRYFCPILIGIAPVAILLAWKSWPSGFDVPWLRLPRAIVTGFALASLLLFSRSFVSRIAQAVEQGSILAFRDVATSNQYLDYNHAVLDGETRAKVQRIQSTIPAKEPFLAWIRTPFDLDFARNPVIDVDIAGLANPWATLPHVRYIIWDYRGFGVIANYCVNLMYAPDQMDRSEGALCARLRELLAHSAERSEILYDDGETLLFRLASPL